MKKQRRTFTTFAPVALLVGCGSRSGGLGLEQTDGGGSGADSGSGSDDSQSGDAQTFMMPDGSAPGTCANNCSSDLHQVLDCTTQKVVKTCPDTMGCNPDGQWWTTVGSRYEYTRVDLQRAHIAVNGCDNGAHVMSSQGPFGVTVWGWDTYVSYAYPAGAAVRSINAVVVPTTPPPR